MFANTFQPPSPIPMRRGGSLGQHGPKLAFMRGQHPAFEGAADTTPNPDRLAMAEQSNTQWAGAYRGFAQYPRETIVSNAPEVVIGSSDSVTSWKPETGVVGRRPLSSRPATANFFGSDPMQFGSVGGGFCSGMSGGGGMTLQGATPAGGFSFLTPGTNIVRPVWRQNYYGPINPTMSSKDLQASSVYNPLPAFGTVVPRLP